ncbi:MAG TPA: HEAT repeat domain-containing protein, partial [Gemmata sp.]|nr:HEAT repeat domain-containing protein [Gemmata sp.]
MAAARISVAVVVFFLSFAGQATADGDGLAARRARLIDAARIRQLAEILRSDPDERRRKAAVQELGSADPRVHPDVMPSLIGALRSNAATVRAAAAETIGRYHTVFPLAGAALESAAEADPSPIVRDAAKQSLWEYHLNGYKSPKGTELFLTQTVEPPIAKPARPAPATIAVVVPPPSVPAAPVPDPILPAAVTLPLSSSPPPGPRVSSLAAALDPLTLLLGGPNASLTSEPPRAKPKQPPLPSPRLT